MVSIYCDGQYVSTVVVPPGGAAPPPPPAPAEVAALTPFPGETIHYNPCLGLTGLPTYFWATVGATTVPPIAATASIRGYTVHVTATPVRYRWDITMDGDSWTVWGTAAGSASMPSDHLSVQPSATWQPEQKGIYTVTLTVSWSGTYTFGGHGITQTSALGPVDQAPQVRPMPVQSIVSVLVAPGYVEPTTTGAPWNPLTC